MSRNLQLYRSPAHRLVMFAWNGVNIAAIVAVYVLLMAAIVLANPANAIFQEMS